MHIWIRGYTTRAGGRVRWCSFVVCAADLRVCARHGFYYYDYWFLCFCVLSNISFSVTCSFPVFMPHKCFAKIFDSMILSIFRFAFFRFNLCQMKCAMLCRKSTAKSSKSINLCSESKLYFAAIELCYLFIHWMCEPKAIFIYFYSISLSRF